MYRLSSNTIFLWFLAFRNDLINFNSVIMSLSSYIISYLTNIFFLSQCLTIMFLLEKECFAFFSFCKKKKKKKKNLKEKYCMPLLCLEILQYFFFLPLYN